jgi:hypothetical protein
MLNDITWNGIPTKVMESIFQTGDRHEQEALNLNAGIVWANTAPTNTPDLKIKPKLRPTTRNSSWTARRDKEETAKVARNLSQALNGNAQNQKTVFLINWDAKHWLPEEAPNANPGTPTNRLPGIAGWPNMGGGASGPRSITNSDKKKCRQIIHANICAKVQGALAGLVTMQDIFP